MLHRILLASAATVALTGGAIAADLPTHAPPPSYLPPPVFTWTGLYVGGQIGYKWGTDSVSTPNLEAAEFEFEPTQEPRFFSVSPNGAIGGAHIGYNWQMAQWVLGVEADVDATNFNGTKTIFDSGDNRVDFRMRSTIEGSFRGRVGFAWDRWLIYGTGGIAFTDVETQYNAFVLFDSRTKTRVGWTAGGGIDYGITNNWIVGVEYRYSDFDRFTDTSIFGSGPGFLNVGIAGNPFSVSHHVTQNRVEARVSYKFDGLTPGPFVAKY